MIIPTAMKKLLRMHTKTPLNDNELLMICDDFKFLDMHVNGNLAKFARVIEKAHGIE